METVSFPRIRRSRFILVGDGDDESALVVPKVSASAASAAESRRLVLRARFRPPALSARGLKEISLSTRSSSSDSAAESRGGGGVGEADDEEEASSNPSRRSTSYSAPRTPPFAENKSFKC